MESFPFQTEYQITLSDYRKVSYYGLFLRYRRPLQILFAVLIGAGLYCLGALLGLGQINIFVPLLAGAYLVWGLLLFAGAEKAIRTYLRQDDCLIGCTYSVLSDKKQIRLQVPERKIDVFLPIAKLAFVFETSFAFLLYTSAQDVYILPVRALSDAQRKLIRENLRKALPQRFSTRFS